MEYKIKFAIGSPSGVSSSAWTICARQDDLYLWTWLSSGMVKVSLHASGDCQWSGNEKWVQEFSHSNFRNQDRHFERWRQPEPDPSGVTILCRLLFPASDFSKSHNDVKVRSDKNVVWLPNPGRGMATEVNCLLSATGSPSGDLCPTPGVVLGEHALATKGRLTVTANVKQLTDEDETAFAVQRMKMHQGALLALGDPLPEGLISTVFKYQENGVHGFIELSLEEGVTIAAPEDHPTTGVAVKTRNPDQNRQ